MFRERTWAHEDRPPLRMFHRKQELYGLPWWLSGGESTCCFRRHGFNPWAGKIPLRSIWQPIPVFLPGKSRGQKSLAGYSPWGRKTVRHNIGTKQPQAGIVGEMECSGSGVMRVCQAP